jgi:hypothetical protein
MAGAIVCIYARESKELIMNERDFFYWLQGFFELSGSKELTEAQVDMIKRHMALVAVNKTQDMNTNIFNLPTMLSC